MTWGMFLLIGLLVIGAFLAGIGVGIAWVRGTKVVLDRGVHAGFLRTLADRTRQLDALSQGKSASRKTPHQPTIAPRRLRIWNSSDRF
ncbi:MAG TPA: hypothetical protein VNQ76_07550 [Planctomicrobium sp.]|nr:hypothetical protein [Planctomicrobium sp.]